MLKRLYQSKNMEAILGAAALIYIFVLVAAAAFLVQFIVHEGILAFRVSRAPTNQLPAFEIEKVQE